MTTEKKPKLLKIATFCDRNGINMTKIAARLDMSRGLLHHHLRRTETLDPALQRRVITQLKALANKILAYAAKLSGDRNDGN